MKLVNMAILLFLASLCHGQINIINQSLIDSSLNYFYIGIDNQVEIVGLKISPDHTITISGEGTSVFSDKGSKYTPGNSISVTGENRYIVRTYTPSDSCFIRIYKGKKEIFGKRFVSRVIPRHDVAVATMTGMLGKTISMDTLLNYPFLSVSSPGCYLKECYQIISFDASIDRDGSDSIYYTEVTGNYLTAELIEYIKKTGKGKLLAFQKIRCKFSDGSKGTIPSLWIKIQ